MSRIKRGKVNVKGGTLRQMQGTSRKKKAIYVYHANGLLLSHYEKGYGKICEKMSWLPGARKFNPHPSLEPTKHGYFMALSHMGARFGGTNQSPFQRVHLDPYGHGIFY